MLGDQYQQRLLDDGHCCRNWLRPYRHSYHQVGKIQDLLDQVSQ